MLKTGVSLGSKIVNNPILNKAVDIATPFLSVNPYGRAALLGFKGVQKAFQFGDGLVRGIDSAERAVKSIQKMWVNMVKCLICLARKHLFFWIQTSIYVHENAIAAIKIGVLFWGKNQAFNPVHPQIRKGDYLGGTGGLIGAVKGGFDAQSGIKRGSEGMKSSVIGIREQFS